MVVWWFILMLSESKFSSGLSLWHLHCVGIYMLSVGASLSVDSCLSFFGHAAHHLSVQDVPYLWQLEQLQSPFTLQDEVDQETQLYLSPSLQYYHWKWFHCLSNLNFYLLFSFFLFIFLSKSILCDLLNSRIVAIVFTYFTLPVFCHPFLWNSQKEASMTNFFFK